ncbi:hypothetical protein J2T56_001868 [Natronobacillus azotifigens]|uniref:AimR family lysis-lysogeny pheromone receptor n=1 Tax=Natronobacillus azotifigens TaxID=472978 RepID=A0A9J6RDX4_9BACI|nr:AimR family lysis-lysogeny pheromone receptor [Natronobacillus azotifigens]MCZ0703669.1 AimR family lysis-lysogeny pheromone receptor [Natronobacillus azotifigens]
MKVNSFRKGEEGYGKQLKLHQYVNSLGKLYDEETLINKMCEFCLQTTDQDDMRVGLEYLYMNGCYDALSQLIERNKQHTNKENNAWAHLYELTLAKQKRTIPHHKILEQVMEIKTYDPGLRCIIEYLMLSIHFDLFEYERLAYALDSIQLLLQRIDNPLLVSLLKARLDAALFIYYWKRNEMILARKYGFRIINETTNNTLKANLNINLSLTYIFDDFENSYYHLEQAKQIAEEKKLTRLISIIENHNIPFIYAHFNRPDGISTNVISEEAHLEIAKGNFPKAQRLLSEITEVTPFINYYLGRAHQDRRLLFQSYNEFIEQRSDHFFARLPLQALQKL